METQRLPHDHGQKIERKLENMPSAEDFQAIAVLLKQLGDGSRLRLFGSSAMARSASSTFPPWSA